MNKWAIIIELEAMADDLQSDLYRLSLMPSDKNDKAFKSKHSAIKDLLKDIIIGEIYSKGHTDLHHIFGLCTMEDLVSSFLERELNVNVDEKILTKVIASLESNHLLSDILNYIWNDIDRNHFDVWYFSMYNRSVHVLKRAGDIRILHWESLSKKDKKYPYGLLEN